MAKKSQLAQKRVVGPFITSEEFEREENKALAEMHNVIIVKAEALIDPSLGRILVITYKVKARRKLSAPNSTDLSFSLLHP